MSLQDAYKKLGVGAVVSEPLAVDMELSLDMISNQLLLAQKQCAPFGHSNPKPLYLISNVKPVKVEVFGKIKEHTKLVFETKGIAKEAIAFFKLPDSFTKTPSTDSTFSMLAHLEESYFMNRLQVRLRVVDII
jgi:single-stranded DNA-specific DHH superfamily exonuclease